MVGPIHDRTRRPGRLARFVPDSVSFGAFSPVAVQAGPLLLGRDRLRRASAAVSSSGLADLLAQFALESLGVELAGPLPELAQARRTSSMWAAGSSMAPKWVIASERRLPLLDSIERGLPGLEVDVRAAGSEG